MVTLGLTVTVRPSGPEAGDGKPPAPAADPVARRVLLWVGVSDPVMSGMRDRLPGPTKDLLNCCDQGFKHSFPSGNTTFEVRRIRYERRKPLGYGIIVAEWRTIGLKTTIPDYMTPQLEAARRILQRLGMVTRVHLTDHA